MPSPSALHHPTSLDELLLFRLGRLLAIAGAPVIRLCEGQYGITRREWRLIAVLAQQGPMLSSVLAERAHLDRGRTSKTVSDLVRKSLLVRTPLPQDRRYAQLRLTEAAQAIYDALFPVVVDLNQSLLSGLDPADVQHFDTVLAQLQQRAAQRSLPQDLPKADRRKRARAAAVRVDRG
jgi:DNA-binding MarR family transcriptional regulator